MHPLPASGSQPGAASGSQQEAGLDAERTSEGQEATGLVFRPAPPQLTKKKIEDHEDSEALQEQVVNSIVQSQITHENVIEVQPVGAMAKTDDWWMGQVVFCEGGARNPEVNSLFQIADVDDGSIRWVCADEVTHVLHGLDGINL